MQTFLTICGVWKTKSMRLRLSMYIYAPHAAESKYRISVLNFKNHWILLLQILAKLIGFDSLLLLMIIINSYKFKLC